MADSDGEYVENDMSDDDFMDHQVTSHNPSSTSHEPRQAHASQPRRTRNRTGGAAAKKKPDRKAAWEDVKRSWEAVVEGADGSLSLELLEAEKRKRLLRDTTPLQRGIIRHLILVIDMSFAMNEKDLLPTRFFVTMRYAKQFVTEYFEQNPISQMGIVGMREGVAVRVSEMGGDPGGHIEKLKEWTLRDPDGNASLQNALEMCRGALLYVYLSNPHPASKRPCGAYLSGTWDGC
jgi:transcription initiation factor TFIIH subunit 2